MRVINVAVIAIVMSQALTAQNSENLNFVTGLSEFNHIRQMLPSYLNRQAFALLDERARKVRAISSARDIVARQKYIREQILRSLGGMPERTPLHARVTGVLDRDGYRIEKIIFESQPHFFVTANLYVPKVGRPPYPAILYPLGHEEGGKANPMWQTMLVSLVRRGYVAFTWDPLGEGERSQFYDRDLEDSKLGHYRYTTEHTMLGLQCLLAGDNLARYTIWDGIRALDYLLSRKEVDPKRVAVTGNSGGGTHSAYLAALDDRLQVVAPSCYLTSWRRLLETIGPQDAEQCFGSFLSDGLDHSDFVIASAPKPYLMLSAIRDFFPISGARATFREASRIYEILGAAERLRMVEIDDGHGYNQPRRLAAYAWLGRWLKGAEDDAPEAPVQLESEEALRATDSGQVAVSLGGETVYSLNLQRVHEELADRKSLSRSELQREVRSLTGYAPRSGPLKVTPYGTVERSGYRIEKLTYESEPGIIVPALLFVPESERRPLPAIVYVNEKGKAADAEVGGAIEQLVKTGAVVLSIEPRGTGETAVFVSADGGLDPGYFGDYADAMRTVLMGKTLIGMRAADITRGVDLLSGRSEVDSHRIYGIGRGTSALPLLHAALLDQRIGRLALEGMLASYASVTRHRLHRHLYESVVPGVLKSYDLPDLVAALAPHRVWVIRPVDPMGKSTAEGQIQKQYARAVQAFQTNSAAQQFRLIETLIPGNLNEVLREWTAP